METTSLRIELQLLTGNDLDAYAPDSRFWTLRSLWRDADEATEVRPRHADLVVVRVAFCNDSYSPADLAFDNTACKAELHHLVIGDDQGRQIQPVRHLHIRPQAAAIKVKSLDAHSTSACDIVGEVADGWLVFPGAKYAIPANRIIDASFRFQGATSNVVRACVGELA